MDKKVGRYAFLFGVALAVVVGLLGLADAWVTFVLVILGLIAGFLNVTAKETTEFLVAAVALMLVGGANLAVLDALYMGLGTVTVAILDNIVVFVAPAALVVALKAVKSLGEK